ncbi:hypothetical protein ACQKLP_12970 [Chitinophaga sp. NPDC101104]|uniref:hypothetical protein n=1 Tax=Chitinophaga sp. NPDC101104 TaxID=3390561 RepID=UPI003D090279
MTKRQFVLSGIILFISLTIVVVLLLWNIRNNMVKLAQPDLTKSEAAYLRSLEEHCNCDVAREVDPRAEVRSLKHARGWYYLELRGIKCAVLNTKDSLNYLASEIARKLHSQILAQNFNYDYREITVSFICKTGEMSNQNLSFDFKPEYLEDDNF